MGETAEVSAFQSEASETQPVSKSLDGETWNPYQRQQEQLCRITEKETEPVFERGKELCENFLLLRSTIVLFSARIL